MVPEWTKRIAADEMRNKEEKVVSRNLVRIAMVNAPNSRTIGSRPAFRQQADLGPVKWLRIGKTR
jgi:nuclear transport factor 2 (NTF2) superfamily protein